MEKLPHQEYRDELADKLKEIRNSDTENSEIVKAKAQGFLDAKKETPEYIYNKEAHINDVDISHSIGRGVENSEISNRKTLRELRLEYPSLDKYLRSSYKIYELLNIHLENGYYDYEKKEFVIEMIAHEDIQAYEDIVHGGIIAFLIDIGGGIASFIETIKTEKNVKTQKINNINFRLPITVGDNIKIVGKIESASENEFIAKTVIYKMKGSRELPAVTGFLNMKVV
jgi:acyl-coenzyme A thioesterase PaaI-like protein